ncbi:MAG: hypothetical protein OEV06_12045 [Anaerolineae bacterium]|nr:hypothetical protein [Anaerolineae bacterium]
MQPLNILMLILFGGAAITAYLVAVGALFPQPVSKLRAVLEDNQGRLFLIGLVNSLFLAAILAGIFFLIQRTGLDVLAAIPGLLVVGFFFVGVSAGLAGTMQLLAERISPEVSPTRGQLRAAVVLILASALPYVGWLLFLPYVVFSSFGGFVTVLMRHFRSDNAEPVEEGG